MKNKYEITAKNVLKFAGIDPDGIMINVICFDLKEGKKHIVKDWNNRYWELIPNGINFSAYKVGG
jgi:uncharacterized membrane protein